MPVEGDLRRGAYMRRNGVVWQVKLLKDKTIHLENPETGEVDRVTLKQWNIECSAGTTRMVGAPDAGLTDMDKALRKVALSDLPGNVQISCWKKEFFVSAFNDPGAFYKKHLPNLAREEMVYPNKSRVRLEPFSRLVRDAFERTYRDRILQVFERPGATARPRTKRQRDLDPIPAHFLRAPSFSTYCSWISEAASVAIRNGGPDPKLSASRYHDRGPRCRTMSPKVEEWLINLIDTTWLTTAQKTKSTVFSKLKTRIIEHNRQHPENLLSPPSERHVRKYITKATPKIS